MPQGEVTPVGMDGGVGSQAYPPDSLMHPDVCPRLQKKKKKKRWRLFVDITQWSCGAGTAVGIMTVSMRHLAPFLPAAAAPFFFLLFHTYIIHKNRGTEYHYLLIPFHSNPFSETSLYTKCLLDKHRWTLSYYPYTVASPKYNLLNISCVWFVSSHHSHHWHGHSPYRMTLEKTRGEGKKAEWSGGAT